ncbi:hypothetical protein ACQ4PT_027755 [Festuca glaucescens]
MQGEEDEYEEGEDVEEEVHQEGEEVEEEVHREGEEDFYKVSADTDQREATSVLQLMAKKNLRDIFYHARKLVISHYFAEKGERRNKDRLIVENLTIEDAAGWERICPKWCLNKKDGWSALVRFQTEDEEFKAKSIQNKPNRGTRGTQNQRNKPFHVYEKDMAAHKKKDLVEGKVVYYGKSEQFVEDYKKAFKSLHGEDSDPLSQPLDETAVMISGTFLGFEDWCSAARVCGTSNGTTDAKVGNEDGIPRTALRRDSG